MALHIQVELKLFVQKVDYVLTHSLIRLFALKEHLNTKLYVERALGVVVEHELRLHLALYSVLQDVDFHPLNQAERGQYLNYHLALFDHLPLAQLIQLLRFRVFGKAFVWIGELHGLCGKAELDLVL